VSEPVQDNRELGVESSRLAVGGGVTRRDLLAAAASAAAITALPITPADAENAALYVEAARQGQAAGTAYRPKFFTPEEWRELRIMVDLIIPKDAKSGSATEAGVPEYMDFFCTEYASGYGWTREALRWFDGFAYNSFRKSFAKCTDAERRQLLDQVAWPAKAKPEVREGVAHFTRLRDFTASGFFSSKMGVADLGYIGNVAQPEWQGCPPAALKHLGV
jgi:gluconate 2-dehydrogenase gamma chain